MASTLDELARSLPAPTVLRDRHRALALIDAIFVTRFLNYRYTESFSDGVALAHYETGGGDDYFVIFDGPLTFLRVFDHESELSPYANDGLWPGLIDGLPKQLEQYVQVERLGDDDYPRITMALWHDGTSWQHGTPTPIDGVEPRPTDWPLGSVLSWSAESVAADRGRYWSRSLDASDIAPILEIRPLSRQLAETMNPNVDWTYVERVADYAGFPTMP
jgi:hypothetical protein